MDISPHKVAFVIVRARELGAKVGRWDTPSDDADGDTILESRPSDGTGRELQSFIRGLNEDEKAALVAIMWIGRETFDDYAEAFETAKQEAIGPTDKYLLGIPLLPDYLEDGLESLGVDTSEIEDEIYRKV
ncbi:MAG: DUF3775 domain-containing protein [Rhodobacteraceae bacterium]|uniref:DUF3775 domain-containing protein n=1 Tax=unclassified Celeribacter TaxID=2618893 RepID=UPI00142FB804|nr:DUF3775 domain-containing protein [Celeribacter sp. HF31]NIY79578.1 DUF3775 domain-containing protein [Celeribacter sp. HF31]NVK47616.1 DUF3775 domain-containing protein [Paracoccaceae bacterium]